MNRIEVQSSNLAEVGYDPDSKTLEVKFVAGAIYQYHGVPAETYETLMNCDSKGAYLSMSIKNKYECERVKT